MPVPRSVAVIAVCGFTLLDIVLSILFLVRNDILIIDHGRIRIVYDIHTSQLDHCLLVLIRVPVMLGALIGLCYNPKSAVDRIQSCAVLVTSVFLTLIVYSPIKLLLLAEVTTDFRIPWFWALFAWNTTASTVCALVWTFVLGNVKTGGPEIVKVEENGRITNDTSILVDNEAIESGTGHADSQCPKGEEKEEEKEVGERVKEATSLMWRLIRYTKTEWIFYTFGFIFLLFYSAARIFIPYFTGRVISDVVVQHSYDRLLQSVLIMSLLSVGSAVFAALRGGCFKYALDRMGIRLRSDLFAALVKQEIGFFDVTKTGDITSRLSADCQTVADTIALNCNVFLRSSIMLIGTLVFMFELSWQLTVMTFVAMPVIGIVTKVYGQFYERLSKESQDALAKANEVAEEVLSSMRTVRSFANEVGESKRYTSKMMDVLSVRKRQAIAYVGYMWINEQFNLMLLIAVLWYGGHLVLTNRLKSDDLIAFLLYQLQMGEALAAIGYVFTGLMQAVGASRKVFEWIDRRPAIPNDGQTVLDDVKGRVEFNDVSFSYPSRPDAEVLKGVSFSAKPGEVVALVGPSGGGKSSCIALLEHFYEPTSGSVTLDGVPVKAIDHSFFHKKVSLVGQEPVLFARSITDNIGYGLEQTECTDDAVGRASKLANAHQFIEALPSTYNTDVGEKGVQLSGGQKQRIAIARALIRNPKVLLLDEATSALDAESEYLVKQAIHQNLAGHTVLLIAHRLSTVEKADKIVVIDNGRVVQEGTHTTLLARDGLYRNLVHRQLLGDHDDSTSPVVKPKKEIHVSQPVTIPGQKSGLNLLAFASV